MKIRILSALSILVFVSLCFGSTNNGVIPSASRGGPLPEVVISPDGGYDIGSPTRNRPGVVFARNALDIAGSKLVHTQVNLTAANLIAMYTTPVALIPAQGAGKSIVVSKLVFTITRTSTAFTGGGAAIVQYAATANGAGTQALDSTLASTVITGSAGTSISTRNGAVMSDGASTVTQNVGLFISNATAVFAAGTGTATVDIWWFQI